MKSLGIIPKVLLSLSLCLILISWPIIFLTSNDISWVPIQKRNNIPLTEGEIKMYDKEIISFFKNDYSSLSFLTQEEFSHMQDVRTLLMKLDISFLISLWLALVSVFYLRKLNFIKHLLKKVSIIVLIFLAFLFAMSLFSFNSFFSGFHEMFFVSNFSFQEDSMLKILYPDSFFRDIFILYFILAILGCLATIAVSYKLKGLKNRR